jgi:hypothetical protein
MALLFALHVFLRCQPLTFQHNPLQKSGSFYDMLLTLFMNGSLWSNLVMGFFNLLFKVGTVVLGSVKVECLL